MTGGLNAHAQAFAQLATVYKQINAPFGQLSFDVLAASTRALASGSASDDATYNAVSDRIAALTADRDALAAQIRAVLAHETFGGPQSTTAELNSLAFLGERLLMRAHQLGAANSP